MSLHKCINSNEIPARAPNANACTSKPINDSDQKPPGEELVGKEVGSKLRVRVYSSFECYAQLIVSKVRRGFNQNWNNVDLFISHDIHINDFEDLCNCDVVVIDTNQMTWNVAFLNRIFESTCGSLKGLVLFNYVPADGFNHSCFEDGSCDYYYLQSPNDFTTMIPTRDDDPLLRNVKPFLLNCGRINTQCISGTLVATIEDGTPLFAKNVVCGQRFVEFLFHSNTWGNVPNDGPFESSSECDLLIANAVAWCGHV
ncbi:hypothetical protein P9112_009596 [Eukaryota sp. TZLM1-RC]